MLLFWKSQILAAKIAAVIHASLKTKQERSSALGSYLLKVWIQFVFVVLISRWICLFKVFLCQICSFQNNYFYSFLSEPPYILEKPESMNVLPGSKVHFNVLLSGTPPLTIKWFKNKKEILSTADCTVMKDNTSTSLALFFAKSSDSGDFVCEIQNDVGSTSCQATLFVKGYHSLCETKLINMSPSFPHFLVPFALPSIKSESDTFE